MPFVIPPMWRNRIAGAPSSTDISDSHHVGHPPDRTGGQPTSPRFHRHRSPAAGTSHSDSAQMAGHSSTFFARSKIVLATVRSTNRSSTVSIGRPRGIGPSSNGCVVAAFSRYRHRGVQLVVSLKPTRRVTSGVVPSLPRQCRRARWEQNPPSLKPHRRGAGSQDEIEAGTLGATNPPPRSGF